MEGVEKQSFAALLKASHAYSWCKQKIIYQIVDGKYKLTLQQKVYYLHFQDLNLCGTN